MYVLGAHGQQIGWGYTGRMWQGSAPAPGQWLCLAKQCEWKKDAGHFCFQLWSLVYFQALEIGVIQLLSQGGGGPAASAVVSSLSCACLWCLRKRKRRTEPDVFISTEFLKAIWNSLICYLSSLHLFFLHLFPSGKLMSLSQLRTCLLFFLIMWVRWNRPLLRSQLQWWSHR